jgi:hypothetical protein
MFNFFNKELSLKEGEFLINKSIFKDNGYECNIYNIPNLLIPQNTWSFDLHMSIKVIEPKLNIWIDDIEYIKYHIEGVKTRLGWDLNTKTFPNSNFLNFFIERNGEFKYSSEKKCIVKYKLLLN